MGATRRFERPAVFFVNRLGDQLFSLPAMRALAAIFPTGMHLLLGEDMRALFYRGLPVGEPTVVRWAAADQQSLDAAGTFRTAVPPACDVLVCLSPDPQPFLAPLVERLGAPWTIGYGEGLDEQLAADHTHAFERLFAIPRRLDPTLQFERFIEPPTYSPAAEAAAVRFLSAARGRWPRALFVHPETSSERMWPGERLAWVLERFLAARPDFMVLVASLDPVDLGSHGDRVRWIDQHLELTLALMKHMDLFLGVDSCFLHAADLDRVPGVALFGPTLDWEKGFHLSPGGRHVTADTMEDIQPEPVLLALLDVVRPLAVLPTRS